MSRNDHTAGFECVKAALRILGRFSEDELHVITNYLKPISVTKDFCLVSEGQVCQSLYFVQQGSFRHYLITDSGEEIIQNLYLENDWMLDYKSFTSQKPAVSIIKAMEEGEVLALSVYDLHKLMKISDVFFQIGRIFQYAITGQEISIQNETPKERYASLLVNKPQVIQRFPLKFIASYLGMTPETLSRVRKTITSF